MGSRNAWIITVSVLVILVIGLVAFAVSLDSTNSDLERQLESVRRDLKERTDAQRLELNEKLAAQGVITGPGEPFPGAEAIREQYLKELPAKLQEVLGTSATPDYKGLVPLCQDLVSFAKNWYDQSKNFERQLIDTNAMMANKDKTHGETVQKMDQVIEQGKEENSKLRSRVEALEAEKQQLQEKYTREVTGLNDQMTQLRVKYEEDLLIKENQIKSKDSRLKQLLEQIRPTVTWEGPREAAGSILKVDRRIAWIDIGRKHHVREGMVFKVFRRGLAGSAREKGKVEVRKVLAEMSEASVLEEADEFDPIVQGDQIASPFYRPDEVPVFVIAGTKLETQDMSLDYFRRLIVEYGGKLDADVTMGTKFLIVIEGYDTDPASRERYEQARDLAIPIIREEQLLGYMGR